MKLKEILDKSIQFLKDKKFETPRLDAELLIAGVLNLERIQLYVKFDQPLSEVEIEKCRQSLRRRIAGEPVAYILGVKDFFGLQFKVNSDVLIPRPETEHIVEKALAWIESEKIDSPKILDLGCGSGCVGLSIVKNVQNANLVGVDKSEGALAISRANSLSLKVEDRAQFIQCDLLDKESVKNIFQKNNLEKFDLIVGNPPYIAKDDKLVEPNVVKFEPHMALFSEDQGYSDLKNWTANILEYAAAKMIFILEMGYNQGPEMKQYFENLKVFKHVEVIKDLSGNERIILGARNG